MEKIKEILEEYCIDLKDFTFIQSEHSFKENNVIYYNKVCDALTLACNDKLISLDNQFKNRGIMLDLSRAKVYTVKTIKKIIVKSSCMGYNYLTLYMEDLINLKNYPQYGYLRGRFEDKEIKELINFANKLDFKIIPAIQTLGHMEHFLRWDASEDIKDTDYVLNVRSDKTYIFLEELISKVVLLFGKDCINIGMDEAFDLGFSFFKTEKINQKKLFIDHLEQIVKICKSHNITKVKMWSDMLFSIYSNTDGDNLYSLNFAGEVQKIDPILELVYWNYWTLKPSQYKDIIDEHYKFTNNVSLALAIHTSMNLFYDNLKINATQAGVEGSRNSNIDDVLYTMWSEDGANYVLDTTLFGMYETTRVMLGNEVDEEEFENITGYKYSDMVTICNIKQCGIDPISILWNDPLANIYYKSVDQNILNQALVQLNEIKLLNKSNELNIYFNTLVEYLRLDLAVYLAKDFSMSNVEKLKMLYNEIFKFIESMWLDEAKVYGIEDIQKRFSHKIYRYEFMLRNEQYKIQQEEDLIGKIKPRFIQIYSPNKSRF